MALRLTGLWSARNEGMEKNMDTTAGGYTGTTIRIRSFVLHTVGNGLPRIASRERSRILVRLPCPAASVSLLPTLRFQKPK